MRDTLASNLKIAAAVSAATISTGVSAVLEWIPADIGKLATLVGIVLSCVLIYTHLRRGTISYEKTKLEIELLKKADARREAEAARRDRRADDSHPPAK